MSDTWSSIQAHKKQLDSLRERLQRRRKQDSGHLGEARRCRSRCLAGEGGREFWRKDSSQVGALPRAAICLMPRTSTLSPSSLAAQTLRPPAIDTVSSCPGLGSSGSLSRDVRPAPSPVRPADSS